jgi:hypothetical protein
MPHRAITAAYCANITKNTLHGKTVFCVTHCGTYTNHWASKDFKLTNITLRWATYWYENTKIKIHRSIILPVVLYGCETWSLTLREKHRLRVLKNRVLRRIFGPKRDEVTGEWRRLHNEELNNLYSSPNIVRVIKSRRMRWAGHVARMGEGRGAYRILVGRPEGRRPLGRTRHR